MPLDIFRKVMENKTIENKLEAWLMLIICDEPERIIELLEKYPEFRNIYEEVYEMCRNVEGIMGLFSEELAEMDRNMISYMIEELEEEIKSGKRKNKSGERKGKGYRRKRGSGKRIGRKRKDDCRIESEDKNVREN